MAEAYLQYLAGELFEVFRAGIEPRELSAAAVLVMDDVEIDISHHYCKNVEEYLTFHFKFVIGLCELALGPYPIFRFAENFQHWHFPNTFAAQDLFQAKVEEIRGLRDQIKHKVWEFIADRSLRSSSEAILKQ
jgi:arsenate reductase